MALIDRNCVPCHGGVPALGEGEVKQLRAELDPAWEVTHGGTRLRREIRFPDFKTALTVADRIGAMADEQGHHPDLHVAWGRLVVEVWTHAISGLTESDFVFAAKCDRLLEPLPGSEVSS